MYIPRFDRYSPAVTAGLARIAEAAATIGAARILPAQEEILRHDALVGSVHFSNAIEGNTLPEVEAVRAVEHELDANTKAKLELINYVAALEWIDERYRAGEIAYTPDFAKALHRVMTRGLGRDGTRFEPHHEGEWRDKNVVVGDAMTIYHEAPPPEQVPEKMRITLEWLETNRTNSDYFGAILAAVGHFELAEVHPFADYNGRAARLFAVAILTREKTLPRRLFSPERYYAEDREAYYEALRSVKRTHNLNDWLEYYVAGLASEMERVATKVAELNQLTDRLEQTIQLNRNQEKIVAALTAGDRADLSRPEVEVITGLSRSRAFEELAALVATGVLRQRGQSVRTTYVLNSALTRSRPRRGRWNEARIRDELSAFAQELGRWPTHRDFKAAGRTSLYLAASKHGGLRNWASELGY